MKLLVGLGNPGARYDRNRHNVGFMAIDRIAQRHRLGPVRTKFQGELIEGSLDGLKVQLLKPQTYMNESGRSVAQTARFFKIGLGDIIVFHDELDLAPGKMRVKKGGGVAGHNGLRSMDAHLGSKDFLRVRIGIGHPGHKELVVPHVLSDFHKADRDWLDPLLDAMADAAPLLARGEDQPFMSRVAFLTRPPRQTADGGKAHAQGEGGPAAANDGSKNGIK